MAAPLTTRQRGQAATEFLMCTSLLVAVLFVPWIEGTSASTLLTRSLVEAFRGLFFLIAVS